MKDRNGEVLLSTPFDFVTPVWGDAYTRLFLGVGLRTYLAEGNLPDIAKNRNCIYRIYTTNEEAELISNSSVVAALRDIMKVEILIIKTDLPNKYERMSYCHRLAIECADARDAATVFLAPDAVAGRGSLLALLRLTEAGKRVVFSVGLRLQLETVAPILKSMAANEDSPIAVTNRDLMRIALPNLHPITNKHIWNNNGDELISNNIFWLIPGEGLLGRCFHALPLLVHPRVKRAPFLSTIDDDYVQAACPNPADWHVVEDSDEVLLCELSAVENDIQGVEKNLDNVISFAELHANSNHRLIVKTHILMHTGSRTAKEWGKARKNSDDLIDAVLGSLLKPSRDIFFSHPGRIIRRFRRHFKELSIAQLGGNGAMNKKPNKWTLFPVIIVSKLLEILYENYSIFVRTYLPIRHAITMFVFGYLPTPRIWHWQWLKYRGMAKFKYALGKEQTLFVSTLSSESVHSGISGIRSFTLAKGSVYSWPFHADTYSSVCIMLRRASHDEILHALAEGFRVLKPEGCMLIGGLSPSGSLSEYFSLMPGDCDVLDLTKQEMFYSEFVLGVFRKLRRLYGNVPGRLFLEFIIFPLWIVSGIIFLALINTLVRALDLSFRLGHRSEATILLKKMRKSHEAKAMGDKYEEVIQKSNSSTWQLSGLTSENKALTERVNELTGENNVLTGRVNELTGENNVLTGRVNELTGENNVLTGRVNNLTGENSVLVMEGHRLRQDILLHRKSIAVMKSMDSGCLPTTVPNGTNLLHKTLVDAPQSTEEALSQANDLHLISKRIDSGYYQDRLIVISCLEKSGSTMLEICVRDMQCNQKGVKHDVGIQRTLWSGPFSGVGQLYPEVLLYAKEGGVLRAVLKPMFSNLQLIKAWGCKHIILLRHPADRLIGRYCDRGPGIFKTYDGRPWSVDPQLMFDDIINPDCDVDYAIMELICGGYLLDTLAWITNWLKIRDFKRSVVVKYENFVAGDDVYFNELNTSLFGAEIDQITFKNVRQRIDDYRLKYQPGSKDARRYPKGYSGEVGIWRSYFSDQHVEAFRRVVGGFVNSHKDSHLLLNEYPDLLYLD